MDGLDWSSDTFKNQAYNLRVGRVDLLRQHIGYKVCAILQLIINYPLAGELFFIGDNAESDAYIYLGIKLFLEGRLDGDGFSQYLDAAEVDPDIIEDIVSLELSPSQKLRVGGILIRQVPGYELKGCPPLTDAITLFDNYMTAALHLHRWGVVSSPCLPNLVRRFHNFHGLSRERLYGLLAAYAESSAVERDAEMQRTLGVLAVEGGTAPESDKFTEPDLGSFQKLGQDEIVSLAKEWFGAMQHGS